MYRSFFLVFVLISLTCPAGAEVPEVPGEPRELGIEERATARLAQFEISVSGEPELIRGISAADLEIKIGLTKLADYTIDPLCGEIPTTDDGMRTVPEGAGIAYLFYFDQAHLTLSGRARAISLARELVPRLIAENGRIMIVSNADRIATLSDLSGNTKDLLHALDLLEKDRTQWDTYATLEPGRVDEVLRALNEAEDLSQATTVARRHQRYERWLCERNLRRLEMVMGRLAQLQPPKAVVYFADTMRSNPGEHYISLFNRAALDESTTLATMEFETGTGRMPYDSVIEEASATGIRFYTIHAGGLTMDAGYRRPTTRSMNSWGSSMSVPTLRIRHAEDTLAGMAAETGGAAFLYGAKGSRIADSILSDLTCILLISFDPREFDQDTPLRLKVTPRKEGLKVHARGQIVLQSESARTTSLLKSAFAMPGARAAEIPMGVSLYPIDYADGKFRLLLQIHTPALEIHNASWDLGASLVAGGKVVEEVSGHVAVRKPGYPVVLEKVVSVPPGDLEIVAVAHETMTNRVTSIRTAGNWPDPDRKTATLGPVALVQQVPGAFLREGDLRTTGSLVTNGDLPIRHDLKTALVALVCRRKKNLGGFRIERTLTGTETTPFPPIDSEPGEDRCIQVRDVIEAGELAPGVFRYEMSLLVGDEQVDTRTMEFVAIEAVSAD